MASYDLLAIIIREPDANTDVSFLDFSYFSADLPADGGNDEGGTDDTVGGEDTGNNDDNTADDGENESNGGENEAPDNGNTNEDESDVQPENPDTGVVPSVAAMITAAVSAVFVVTKRR